MLKWAVYTKKGQDVQVNSENEREDFIINKNKPYDDKLRRSLDAQSVKKSKKPSRYQRRSLGAAARKNGTKNVDKENINFVGHTPNYYREGFKKSESNALKDVSNITPTSVTPHFERRKFYYDEKDLSSDLPPTPPTYSRRVREAKKRKLEMAGINNNEVFSRNSVVYKSERRIKNIDRSHLSSTLSHSLSEPSLNDLSERLSASTENSKNSLAFAKAHNIKPVCTTKAMSEDVVEIEYDEDLVINCVEKPLDTNRLEKSTLPIFGHRMFTDNPLYFNKNESDILNIRSLKRTRKKSNEFESSFKSPSVDKRDTHALVRDGCSPVSITPLSVKLAALRFSAMSTHTKPQRVIYPKEEITEYFPKIDNPFTIPIKDEESSTELENKYILSKDSIGSVSDATVSTTQMGDITLERMIEDIIKSTKIVKSKRRILQKELNGRNIESDNACLVEAKPIFVNPPTKTKTNLIKEAKCVNISRENSLSPKASPTKKLISFQRDTAKLLKNVPIGGYILDDGDGYNEREVKTPDVDKKSKENFLDFNRSLIRSRSMNASIDNHNVEYISSESTPDLYAALKEYGLRRQKCIRRKKSTVSNDSQFKQRDRPLSLEMGLPSPDSQSLPIPLSTSDAPSDRLPNNSLRSNVSHSSLKPCEPIQNRKSRDLFGLTLENGIPSPITPGPNLKRTSNILSEERAHKTSKLYEDMLPNDIATPVIEHRSSRRCLTYSPEENSISSSEEKRGSIASNRLERSADRFQALKGTIDLEIITRDELIDVHVIRCRDLQRSSGKMDDINAYAKVVISGVAETQTLPSQRSIFQRTSVLYGKREPEFQRHLKLSLPPAIYEHQMLHISVWHRDKKYRLVNLRDLLTNYIYMCVVPVVGYELLLGEVLLQTDDLKAFFYLT
ncbi:unnamed protein product [Leptosia nina]|uniref:C2 domain-containing protein n=1 Tax=Leptosia nina TaxID=320188 RepID=A0AAV1JG14_9NEOP